jgi:hypothetical protein
MNTTLLIIVIAAAVVVIALAVWLAATRRRRTSRALHDRFGPEWDRTVEQADSRRERRAARSDLAERADERDELDIRPLTAASRRQYADEWHETQAKFVDEPGDALAEAERLLDDVMRERGYPVEGFEEQSAMMSVDHPDLVENYRAAHRLQHRGNGTTSTEDMRDAMLRYRSLFEELLSPAA